MFRSIVVLALVCAVSAFAPAGRVASNVALSMAKGKAPAPAPKSSSGFESEIGVLQPVGFFDPLGLSKGIDEDRFFRWRAVEQKHGRVAMAAVTGYVVQEFVRFPGYIAPGEGLTFAGVPNGVAAFGAIPFLGWVQLIAFIGFLETILKQEEGATYPGTFGLGYFTEYGRVGRLEGEKRVEKLTKELQNGRLAMLAIMELLTHDVAKPVGESVLTLHHF